MKVPMEKNIIQVLLVEDNPADARLIQEVLRDAWGESLFKIKPTDRLISAIEHLKEKPDIVLLDLSLPDSQGLETYVRLHDQDPTIPIVVLSGMDDESLALEAVRRGAQDYLVKGKVEGEMLMRVMKYAIERKLTEEKIRKTAEDLTKSNDELAKSSQDLKRANERLKKLDEMKSDFISSASHELRTPLTSIKGYVSIVLQEKVGALNPQQKEFLGYVKDSTDRLHRLLDELLDLSRIESGRMEMKMALTDLQNLVREEMMIFKMQADTKEIPIEFIVNGAIKKVYCDPDKIRQVIGNLISNAIKYTLRKGTIKISIHGQENAVAVDVEDTGIGISKEDQGRIFEPFQRINKPGVEEEEGVGLGLAVVKRIVELHGGKISVRSGEGKGSVFSLLIPLQNQSEEHPL